jgi:hypothetical protein
MAQLAPDPVAHHRIAHSAAHHETDPGRLIVIGADQQMTRYQRFSRTTALSHGEREL